MSDDVVRVGSRVTAVVVNFHCVSDVVGAVQSIRRDGQDVPVVVVDNSADPQEAQALRLALQGVADVLEPGRNLGFGEGCNWAARHRPAEFYWLVNPDVRVLAGCLPALVDAMDGNLSLGAVSPRQWLDDGLAWQMSPVWSPSPLGNWVRAKALNSTRVHDRLAAAVMAESARLWASVGGGVRYQRMLNGAALLVRARALEDSGQLFDPQFFMYYEDTDLCKVLRKRGWQLGVVAVARAIHHWRMGPHKNSWMERSAPLYAQKHFAGSLFWDRPVQGGAAVLPGQVWNEGEALRLPDSWSAGWMLELSPLPVFLPSIGQFGSGTLVGWPDIVGLLAPGVTWYARLSRADGAGRECLEYVLR